MFSGDNKFRRMLTADNGKIKILQTTDCVSTFGRGYLYRKRKRTSVTSMYREFHVLNLAYALTLPRQREIMEAGTRVSGISD